MRLKLALTREPKHRDVVAAIGWANGEELISCGDDRQMLKWNGLSGDVSTVATLPEGLYPTDIHWYPHATAVGGKKGQTANTPPDSFVLTSADGHFYLINKTGRVEKTVEAHAGAVLSARWSSDGMSLLTVGEDGRVKVWSRTGLLRSTLAANNSPVYAGCWAASSDQLVIRPLQTNVKATQWKAHDAVILTIDWNPANGLIVSGAEDGKYKVWDSFGRALFSSQTHPHPVTSVAWAPSGQLFAIGSFNTLRLCDRAGWSHTLEKPRTGSILRLRWCPDSTQLAGACANGHVIFGNTVDHRTEWRQFEAVQVKRRGIEIRNCTNDAKEKIEVRDRITKMVLAWDTLVVATTTQLYIYSSKNWNTPIITDLKEASVSLIVMTAKHMLVVDGNTVQIINYDGKTQCGIKFAGMRTELLNEQTVALSPDVVVVKDHNDEKKLHLFDAHNGKPTADGKITHTEGFYSALMNQMELQDGNQLNTSFQHPILQVSISGCGDLHDRLVAFVDKNHDLFVAALQNAAAGGGVSKQNRIMKLGGMVSGAEFNSDTNMLVGLEDSRIVVWTYPVVAYVDAELLPQTIIAKDVGDFGASTALLSFVGSRVTVRRSDGSIISTGINPFPAALHGHIAHNRWDNALRLCRHVKDTVLWATLAAMAARARNLNTAEIAYGAIDEAEKVQFLTTVRETTNKDVKAAELALSSGQVADAERVLLQGGQVLRAIMLNITLYKWKRALELAVKNKTHIDTVIGYRHQYLHEFGWKETNKEFLHYSTEVEVDWEHIQEKVNNELEKL